MPTVRKKLLVQMLAMSVSIEQFLALWRELEAEWRVSSLLVLVI